MTRGNLLLPACVLVLAGLATLDTYAITESLIG